MARTSQLKKNQTTTSSNPAPPRAAGKVHESFLSHGTEPLKVPGFGLPIHHELEDHDRFRHGVDDYAPHRLTSKEVDMLAFMNSITDKPDWNTKVFDEKITKKWAEEALQQPDQLMSEATLEWCFAELRDKSADFERTQFVKALDSDVSVIKSDVLIWPELREEIIEACKPLQNVPESERDWHPKSDGKVLNLVHPSLFPVVYGRTRALSQPDVGLMDCCESCGQGEILEAGQALPEGTVGGWQRLEKSNFWSAKYQWLPSDVHFGEDGRPHFTSYINNLHPVHHQALYGVIEEVLHKSIEPWNQILLKGPRQEVLRIKCTEATYEPPGLTSYDNQTCNEWLRKYGNVPDRDDADDDEDDDDDDADETDREPYDLVHRKWRRCRRVAHPEVGPYKPLEVSPENGPAKLQEDFGHSGLQVIVKLAGIELSPEKPEYKGGSWHLEGQLNEHIVATAIYYYSCENVTPSKLLFRQDAYLDTLELSYEQDDHVGLEEVFGCEMRDEAAVQELGGVATPQGRLLCFPNTLQHCVDKFKLQDPTKPGHRRFLVLWLVDPHYRILSTARVPPQQHEWWAQETLHRSSNLNLAPEIAQMIMDRADDFPMSLDEAKTYRLELMSERTTFGETLEASKDSYNLCEH